MRCCVPFCKNTEENTSKSEWITFHEFPTGPHLRTAWLRALGKQDSHLSDSAVVCSQHFLDDDIYDTSNGSRQICAGAVPSTIQVCMICLDADSKQIVISKYKLETAYEKLTGYSLCDVGNIKHTLCIECAQRLMNFSKFRDKSLRAHSLMTDLVTKHDFITIRHVKSISRVKNQLKSNVVKTMLEPNRCDLYIFEVSDKDQQIELDDSEQRVVETATEKNDESSMLIDDEHTESKFEMISDDENNVDNDESSTDDVSDYSIMLQTKLLNDAVSEALLMKSILKEKMAETQELVKLENVKLECKVCFKTCLDENVYKEHMMVHHEQQAECDSDDPPSRSTSCDSSLATYTRRVQTPSADNATLVGPLLARHLTTYEKQVSPTEEDGIEENKPVFEIDNDELITTVENQKLNTIYDKFEEIEKTTPEKNKALTRSQNLITSCKSYSPSNDNISKDYSYQRTNQSGVSATKTFETRTKQLVVKLDKLNLDKVQQSGVICLNYDVIKECKNSPASNLHSRTKKHTETNEFTCDVCQSVLKSKSTLVKHISAHADNGKFVCKICRHKYKHYSTLVRHMKTHSQSIAKPFSCKLCLYKCARKSNLVSHMRTHTGEKPFSCELCEYKCAQSGHLVSHMRTHSGEKPFSCELCKYQCANRSTLVSHMRTHTVEKPFSCKLCEYKGTQKSYLIDHMWTHTGEKRFSCKLCKYKCAHRRTLIYHMRTHTGEKPFSCKLCEYKCVRKDSLIKHMRTHTGEKPFSCELCEYKCARKDFLVSHMRTHTGEKPFFCKICEYKCARKDFLVSHMRTHTGEKPFSCELCEYKCTRKDFLVIHMRTHTGEKPFSCKVCEYKCAQKCRLVIHMRSHAGEKPFSCK